MSTLLAGAGDPDVKEKLLKGRRWADKTFKTHLDGYNFMPTSRAKSPKDRGHEFFYFTDNGDLTAVRYDDWKVTFRPSMAICSPARRNRPTFPGDHCGRTRGSATRTNR